MKQIAKIVGKLIDNVSYNVVVLIEWGINYRACCTLFP